MDKVSSKYKVLFVCLGNICRSPAAQGIFQHIVNAAGCRERFIVDSAGTYGGHAGQQPDRRMRNAAMYRGYALVHEARKVSTMDFLDSDLIVAMDDSNYSDLMRMAPSVESSRKIVRMADYMKGSGYTYVPDPYYMGVEGFSLVLDLLEESCRTLYESIAN